MRWSRFYFLRHYDTTEDIRYNRADLALRDDINRNINFSKEINRSLCQGLKNLSPRGTRCVCQICACVQYRTPVPFDNHSADASTIACMCVFTREEEGFFCRDERRGRLQGATSSTRGKASVLQSLGIVEQKLTLTLLIASS